MVGKFWKQPLETGLKPSDKRSPETRTLPKNPSPPVRLADPKVTGEAGAGGLMVISTANATWVSL